VSRLAQSIRSHIRGLDEIITAKNSERADAVERNMDTLEDLRDNLKLKLEALARGELLI
jgi:hypothetical protein